MFQKLCLGLDDAQATLAAVMDAAKKDGSRPSIAIADDQGDLVCFVRMDGCPVSAQRAARRKAYTAAIMRMDTPTFRERMAQAGRTLSDYADPSLTTLQGGVVVQCGDQVIAGIGVAGTPPAQDLALSRLAAETLTALCEKQLAGGTA